MTETPTGDSLHENAMQTSASRPHSILLSCALSLALSFWDIGSTLSDDDITNDAEFSTLLLLFSVVPIVFTAAAFFRRNWGRIGMAALSVFGLLAAPLLMLVDKELVGPLDAGSLIYAAAEVVIVASLFVPSSNTWYRRARQASTPA